MPFTKLVAWHSTSRSTDAIMCTPIDSPTWQHIEEQWPQFKKEPWHLCLQLAMGGVNPFGLGSATWSIWLVVLVNYNMHLGLGLERDISYLPCSFEANTSRKTPLWPFGAEAIGVLWLAHKDSPIFHNKYFCLAPCLVHSQKQCQDNTLLCCKFHPCAMTNGAILVIRRG